ncbi:MAG: PVC-type heme-binding CxxCH protein [Planctomycetaceae bacterium]
MHRIGRSIRTLCGLWIVATAAARVAADEPLPRVPPGFQVAEFAREPHVRHPAALAFDERGRPFVGQGPQFRMPKPETPGDTVRILIDADGDGRVDETKTFAEGFNCIQALAWKGRDLWVANAPDLTIVRDLDGDDAADEYVLIHTDLGNLEHGLHGLNWGPDGKLYMSKGNSKGLGRPGRTAPEPFRRLWGVKSPDDAPDFPPPQVFRRGEYRRSYHDPADDWGREGGILRCDDGGKNLEIVCRGFRNPWDIAFDDGFCWLGTDNDQTGGDKIFMPFPGAHFGWGHPWSFHWSGDGHLPTVPASGPLFEGSGTGLVHCAAEGFPADFRGVFFINDWLQRTTFVYRPLWNGALLQPDGGRWEPFVTAGESLYRPTDLELGPDGALWILGWSGGYGATFDRDGNQDNAGRVYRVWPDGGLVPRDSWNAPHRARPPSERTIAQLLADLGHAVPAWRVAAQDELLRRGPIVKQQLIESLEPDAASKARRTWAAWTLGRLDPNDRAIDDWFAAVVAAAEDRDMNLRIQAIRILAHRIREFGRGRELPETVVAALQDDEPRIRFEAVLAIRQARQSQLVDALVELADRENDRVTFYACWSALAGLAGEDALRALLHDERAGVRRAALLALADREMLQKSDAQPLRLDVDRDTAEVATLWLGKNGGGNVRPALVVEPDGCEFTDVIEVALRTTESGVELRYTLDGTPPHADSVRYAAPLRLTQSALVQAAMFRDGRRIGPIASARFHKLSEEDSLGRLIVGTPKAATGAAYRVRHLGPTPKDEAYTDRGYHFTEVPRELLAATWIQGPNDDADARDEALLTFVLAEQSVVWVAVDQRIPHVPDWLAAAGKAGFEDSGFELATSDARMRLFRREFAPGVVTLGANRDTPGGGGRSHYIVLVTPTPLVVRDPPTRIDDVLALLEHADAERGRRLFFSQRFACARCHRVDERGNDYAPELSGIGLRAKPREIVDSILDPDATITEGFLTQTIVTESGRAYSGIVLEESGRALKLVATDGTVVEVERSAIEERRTSKQSAMPGNFGQFLAPDQAADVAAFLISRKRRVEK